MSVDYCARMRKWEFEILEPWYFENLFENCFQKDLKYNSNIIGNILCIKTQICGLFYFIKRISELNEIIWSYFETDLTKWFYIYKESYI